MQRLPTVAILGNPGGISLSRLPLSDSLKRLGLNTGNMLFQYACWKLIRNPALLVPDEVCGYLETIEMLRATADVLVIPAANQLNPDPEFAEHCGWKANLLAQVDKPVIVVGLGLQCPIDAEDSVELKEGTIRYIWEISKRTSLIGVRGVRSQALLNKYGVSNSEVSGCPSNFIFDEVSGAEIADKISSLRERLHTGDTIKANYLFALTKVPKQSDILKII
ncbi:MAG: polysaccharide pyruvyl transferase family protein, partial [Proteobacteria bacterium]|nr:polysaccharide pyruvyl transferase family protein [Pseudomonadota bacterium]